VPAKLPATAGPGLAGSICAAWSAQVGFNSGCRSSALTSGPSAVAGAPEPALAGALLYTPGGAVLDAATGAVVTRRWPYGDARGLTVGNGYVAVVMEPRILDLYSLPGR